MAGVEDTKHADWAAKNRDHFNETAETYNSRFGTAIEQIMEEIRGRREWIGEGWLEEEDEERENEASRSTELAKEKGMRLLDYACGTGLVTRALIPYISCARGIDISEGMVKMYNESANNQGLEPDEMYAKVGNLIAPSPSTSTELLGEEWNNFDLAAVGMGFHHFADPTLAAKRLAERLKKGGVLFIVDFLPHKHEAEGGDGHKHGHDHGSDGHSHSHGGETEKANTTTAHTTEAVKETGNSAEKSTKHEDARHTVVHHGFSEENIEKIFVDAGVGLDFKFVTLGNGIVFSSEGRELKRSLFMARGVKS